MAIETSKFYGLGILEEAEKTRVQTEITRLRDPRYLPTLGEVVDLFDFKRRSLEGDASFTDWWIFCASYLPYSIYECFTQEHLRTLSDYLSQRIDQIGKTQRSPVVILDPCSGNGRLPYFLDQMLAEKIEPDKYGLVAVDNNSWTSSDQNAVFEVKKMDYRAAITQFKPQIIVASWIPSNSNYDPETRSRDSQTDWLDYFRAAGVEEYILIGSPSLWDRPVIEDWKLVFKPDQKYIEDGYVKIEHPDWSKFQLCKYDVDYHQVGSVSSTISFIRQPQVA